MQPSTAPHLHKIIFSLEENHPCSAPLLRNRGMSECWLQTWSIRSNTRCWFQNPLSPPPAWHKPENSPHDSCIWAQSTHTVISSHCTKGLAHLFWQLTILLSLWIILISHIMGCSFALVHYTEKPPSSMFTWVKVTHLIIILLLESPIFLSHGPLMLFQTKWIL